MQNLQNGLSSAGSKDVIMISNKIYSFLGLCTKAGKLSSGDETCEKIIKSLKAKLIIIAEDASNNTVKKFSNMSEYRQVPIRIFGEKQLLGRFTGKETRAVLVINDNGFANKLIEQIDEYYKISGGEQYGED